MKAIEKETVSILERLVKIVGINVDDIIVLKKRINELETMAKKGKI